MADSLDWSALDVEACVRLLTVDATNAQQKADSAMRASKAYQLHWTRGADDLYQRLTLSYRETAEKHQADAELRLALATALPLLVARAREGGKDARWYCDHCDKWGAVEFIRIPQLDAENVVCTTCHFSIAAFIPAARSSASAEHGREG